MAYNRVNILRYYIAIQEETNKHYDPDVTTCKGVWRKYIHKQFYIEYSRFMEVIAMPHLKEDLEKEKKAHGKWEDPKQMKLF